MKPQTTLILLIVLVALATLVLLMEKPFERTGGETVAEPTLFFPDLAPDAITRIVTRSVERTVELNRGEEGWTVLDGELRYPVDSRLVDKVFERVGTISREQLVSRNPDKQSAFQVDSSGLEVQLMTGEDDRAHFYLGKNGPDFFSTYIRLAQEDQVYLMQEYLRSDFDKPQRSWKDRSPLKAEREAITGIDVLRRDGGPLSFLKNPEGSWSVTADGVESPAEEAEMNRLLSGLSNFLASDYANPAEDVETGLADPAVRVSITLETGEKQTALLGNEGSDKRYFCSAEGSNWVLLMPKHRYDLLVKAVEEYRAPTPVPTEPEPEAVPEETEVVE